MEDLDDLDLPAPDALGVWHDLERALAGKSGYGGHVAEIYAYRLVPPEWRSHPQDDEQARLAGKNLTALLRRFARLHDAAVAVRDPEGFRPIDLAEEAHPPFAQRVHLRVTRACAPMPEQTIREVRAAIDGVQDAAPILAALLEELGTQRARQRQTIEDRPPAITDDLPPDGVTGLYLDRSFVAEDLEWIKMAWDAYLRGGSTAQRPVQLMLVFQAIRRDERATTEFLRVMNTAVLPLCRRLRLREQPHLTRRGGAGE